MRARTILVAFCVTDCESMKEAQERLMRQLPDPNHPGVDGIDCWWIAEDERYDGSDNDSAVFVPMESGDWWADYVRLSVTKPQCINTFHMPTHDTENPNG